MSPRGIQASADGAIVGREAAAMTAYSAHLTCHTSRLPGPRKCSHCPLILHRQHDIMCPGPATHFRPRQDYSRDISLWERNPIAGYGLQIKFGLNTPYCLCWRMILVIHKAISGLILFAVTLLDRLLNNCVGQDNDWEGQTYWQPKFSN